MELREFAEQVLFATNLEDKLRDPGAVTDDHPGPAIAAPEQPGRPADLRFKPRSDTGSSGKSEFPGLHQLENPEERGRLLHFFGNHELLATELMALVLLRFPDAPPAFRRGVFQTLRDEQRHTQLYKDRMRDCGIAFGELPVSGFFWRAVSGMESPVDYVAGLCLTFEQANLDFARQFGAAFHQVGDQETARLLDGIYHDEIAHVAYGLKWFRRWKNPEQSDWDAFCRQLKFPLTPRRAKGFVLNPEGRLAAGLDPAFIAQLAVYSTSKGRTPNVHFFNPFAEGFVARGKAFTPVKHQAALARDLANLPQFLCSEDDLVLVPRRPRVQFLADLQQAGFPIPEFAELPAGSHVQAARKVGALRPWAWSPDSIETLRPLLPHVTGENRTEAQRYNPTLARLYSKSWSAALLREFLAARIAEHGPEPWLCTEDEVGHAARTPEEAMAQIDALRRHGPARVVVKESLGLAGSNALRLWEPEITPPQKRWITAVIQNGAEVVVEPWLDRVADFSVQLEQGPRGLELRGFTGLINDQRGQFVANTAAPDHRQRIPASIPRALTENLHAPRDLPVRLHALFANLRHFLEPRLIEAGFVGPLGIDAFVYRDAEGLCRLKPVVEINPRTTLGRLTVELMRHVCPGTHGRFQLVNRASLHREGFTTFVELARAWKERHPLRLEGQPVRRIREGAVCLNDPTTAESCLALFQVGGTQE